MKTAIKYTEYKYLVNTKLETFYGSYSPINILYYV